MALENRSVMTRIIVYPSDSGRSMRKSIAMFDQDLRGVGRGLSAEKYLGTLAWAQIAQRDTYLLISFIN